MSYTQNASMRAILGLPEEETDRTKAKKAARKTLDDSSSDEGSTTKRDRLIRAFMWNPDRPRNNDTPFASRLKEDTPATTEEAV